MVKFYENWKNLTRDQQILQDILGAKIDCVKAPEQQNLRLTHFNHNECMIMDSEIEKLISKGVIEPPSHDWRIFLKYLHLTKDQRNTQNDS